MSEETKYTTVLTKQGLAYETECLTTDAEFHITHIAVGDGNGEETTPNENQTSLINEIKRYPITGEEVNLEKGLYYAVTKIPETDGSFTIRELGGYNAEGKLVMVSNFPPTVKHVQEPDDLHKVYIRMDLCKVNSKTFPSVVDPNLSIPSMDYLTEKLANKADIDLANLTPQGNAKLHYPVFCFNSGLVDEQGQSALCSLENDVLTQHSPCVCTTSDGQTYIVQDNATLDISSLEVGNYNVFYFPETKEIKAYQNKIYAQDYKPENLSVNDLWVDTSVMPYITYQGIEVNTDDETLDTTIELQIVKCVQNARLERVSGGKKLMPVDFNTSLLVKKPLSPYLSNNINSAPELVKWKLEDGVLTLLAGSIGRWAAGKQAPTLKIGDLYKGYPIVDISWDGNNLIYYTQTQQDYSWTYNTYTGYCHMFLQDAENAKFWGLQNDMIYSGTNNTVTTDNRVFYDTEANTCIHSKDNIQQSFPLMEIYLKAGSGVTSIVEIYQTGGYIGSTVWLNKNVSVNLVAKTDKQCGTKSVEHITEYDYFDTMEDTLTRYNGMLYFVSDKDFNNKTISLSTVNEYKAGGNYLFNALSGNSEITYNSLIGTNLTIVNGKIQSYLPRMPYRAADAQDLTGRFCNAYRVLFTGVTIAAGETYNFSLADYLPNDGRLYEVFLNVSSATSAATGNSLNMYCRSEIIQNVCVCRQQTRTTSSMNCGGGVVIPIGVNRILGLSNSGSAPALSTSATISGFRKII